MTSIDGTASQDELGNDIDIDGNMAHDDGSHHIDVHDAEMSKFDITMIHTSWVFRMV